ncbi:FG-GAP repeat protein, partial [Vibrio sp. 10N.286.45.F3]
MSTSNTALIITLSAALMLSGCGSEGALTTPTTPTTPTPTAFNLTTITPKYPDSTTTFTWGTSGNATEYSLCRKDTSKPKSCDVLATTTTTSAVVNGIGVIKNLTSEYFVIAKNSLGEKLSNDRSLTPQELTPLIQYIKASNPGSGDDFGYSVALSSDGNTLAVGAPREDSNGTGANSGAVYLFRYRASTWTQEAYIKASNTDSDDYFGTSVALSSDGNTLAVGADSEDSNG